jgi:hypothetical protein
LAAAFSVFVGYRIGGIVFTFARSYTHTGRFVPVSRFDFTTQLTMS